MPEQTARALVCAHHADPARLLAELDRLLSSEAAEDAEVFPRASFQADPLPNSFSSSQPILVDALLLSPLPAKGGLAPAVSVSLASSLASSSSSPSAQSLPSNGSSSSPSSSASTLFFTGFVDYLLHARFHTSEAKAGTMPSPSSSMDASARDLIAGVKAERLIHG